MTDDATGFIDFLRPSLPTDRREHVARRLASNLIAWLTTVDPDGVPRSVPVWFLVRPDGTVLLYSEPGQAKLRHLAANPQVSLALDVTDVGRDIIRMQGIAAPAPDEPRADQVPGYLAKYTERAGAIFGTVERFADAFTEPLVVTVTRLHV